MNLTLKQALSYFWQNIVLIFAKNTDLEEKLEVDITDAEEGSANLINADSLGGVLASDYALKSDLENLGDTEVQIELDTTLTQSGMAADAKAAGDRITDLENNKVAKTDIIDIAHGGLGTTNAEDARLALGITADWVKSCLSNANGVSF